MSAFALPEEISRVVDTVTADGGRGALIGRYGGEPCRCADCISRDPSRALPRLRVFPVERTKCPRCLVSRGLRGRLCWKCSPKGL